MRTTPKTVASSAPTQEFLHPATLLFLCHMLDQGGPSLKLNHGKFLLIHRNFLNSIKFITVGIRYLGNDLFKIRPLH